MRDFILLLPLTTPGLFHKVLDLSRHNGSPGFLLNRSLNPFSSYLFTRLDNGRPTASGDLGAGRSSTHGLLLELGI